MLSSTNFWMCFAGLIYLVAGLFIFRKEIGAAHAWDKLIALGCVFIAVPLAVFAPEHFHGGPKFIQNMVPFWMPAHSFWPHFVGCALLAAATSLTLRKFVRLSSTLLGLMFFAGAILLASGIGLALNLQSRIAAASIGALMTVLTLSLYLLILILAHGSTAINEGLNYVADTLLYAGAALVLASALPRDPDRVEKT
jgi:hypothetical protein